MPAIQNTWLDLPQMSTPATPGLGRQIIWPGSDGNWYTKGSNGLVAKVAGMDQTGWQTVSFLNSWAATNEAVGYCLVDGDDFVQLRGRVQGGATNTVAFTLPSGVRPLVRYDGPLVTNIDGTFGSVQIKTSGDVQITKPSTVTWLSLTPIRFPLV